MDINTQTQQAIPTGGIPKDFTRFPTAQAAQDAFAQNNINTSNSELRQDPNGFAYVPKDQQASAAQPPTPNTNSASASTPGSNVQNILDQLGTEEQQKATQTGAAPEQNQGANNVQAILDNLDNEQNNPSVSTINQQQPTGDDNKPLLSTENTAQHVQDTLLTPADKDVGPSDMSDLGPRADIGLSADFAAKREKFQKYFGPGSDLIQQFEASDPQHPDDKEPVLYFKLHPNDQPMRYTVSTADAFKDYGRTLLKNFYYIMAKGGYEAVTAGGYFDPNHEENQKFFDDFSKDIEQGYKNFMMHIIADNSGNIPPVLGTMAADAATGGTANVGVLLTMLADTAGAGVGEAANIGVDKLRQYTIKDPFGKITTASKDAAEGVIAGQVVGKLINGVMGGGLFVLDAAAKKLIRTAHELDLPSLMPQQVMDSFIGLTRLTNQVRSMISAVPKYEEAQNAAALTKLRGMSPITTDEFGHTISTSYEDIGPNLRKAWDDYLTSTEQKYPKPNMEVYDPETHLPLPPYEVAGLNADKGLELYAAKSKDEVDRAYAIAREYGNPSFDLSGAKSAADKGLTGRLVDSTPDPITGDITNIRVSPKPSPQLAETLQAVKNIDSNKMGIDDINELRRRLFWYTQPNATGVFSPSERADAYIAKPVFNALNDAIENASSATPSGATATSFAQAWKAASQAARKRFENLEFAKVMQIAKSGDGDLSTTLGSLAQTVATSTTRQWQNLNQLKKLLPPEQFKSFGDAVENVMRQDPSKAWQVIKKFQFDPQSRKILWDDSYWENHLKPYGEDMRDLYKTNIPAILENQNQAWQIINNLVHAGSTNPSIKSTVAVDKIYEMVGGRDSPAGQSIRAGIIDQIINSASQAFKDTHVISGKSLTNLIDAADKKNLMQFLTPQDIKNLKGVAFYLRYIQSHGSDMGSSLESASEFAKIRHLELGALAQFAKAKMISRLLVTKAGQRLFYGNPDVPQMSPKFLRLLGGGLSEITRDRYQEANSPSNKSSMQRLFGQ